MSTQTTTTTISCCSMMDRNVFAFRPRNVSALGSRTVCVYPSGAFLRSQNGIEYSEVTEVLKRRMETLEGSLIKWQEKEIFFIVVSLTSALVVSVLGRIHLGSPFPQPLPQDSNGVLRQGTYLPLSVNVVMYGILSAIILGPELLARRSILTIKERLETFSTRCETALCLTSKDLLFSYPYFDESNKQKLNFMQIAAIHDHFFSTFQRDLVQGAYSKQQRGFWSFIEDFKGTKEEPKEELQEMMLQSPHVLKHIIADPHFFERVIRMTEKPSLLLPAAATFLGHDMDDLGTEECKQLEDFIEEIAKGSSIVEVLLSSPPPFLPTLTFSREEKSLTLPKVLVMGSFPKFLASRKGALHLPRKLDLDVLRSYFNFQNHGEISLDSLQASSDLLTSEPYILLTVAAHFKDKECVLNLVNIVEQYFDVILQKENVIDLFKAFREDGLDILIRRLQTYYVDNVFDVNISLKDDFFQMLFIEAHKHKDLSPCREKCLTHFSEGLSNVNFSPKGSTAAKEMSKLGHLLGYIEENDLLSSKLEMIILNWINKYPKEVKNLYKVSQNHDEQLQELIIKLFNDFPDSFYYGL